MRRTLFAISSVFLVSFSWLLFNAFIPSLTEEFGKANYYSDSLHGRKTSSGEKYDKNELTCAHKSLPFGARVKVTRLDNKKSVIVRVNDRGPFKEGYVIELSRRAAEVVDLVRDGSASVRVEVVPNVDTKTAGTASASAAKLSMVRPVQYSTTDPQPSSAKATSGNDKNTELYKVGMKKSAKSGYGVQLSTLYDADNLLPIITKLQQQWPEKVLVSVERDAANDLSAYRVMIGPFADEQTAKAQQKLAVKRGYKQGFVVDLSEI